MIHFPHTAVDFRAVMHPVRLPYSARAAPSGQAVVFANKDILAVKALETRAVRIVIPTTFVTLCLDVVLSLMRLGPSGFFYWHRGLLCRQEARVVDDDQ